MNTNYQFSPFTIKIPWWLLVLFVVSLYFLHVDIWILILLAISPFIILISVYAFLGWALESGLRNGKIKIVPAKIIERQENIMNEIYATAIFRDLPKIKMLCEEYKKPVEK